MNCKKCGSPLKNTDKFCGECGEVNSNVKTSKIVTPNNFDKIYSLPDDKLLETFINKELEKNQIDGSFIPLDILKRKRVLSIITALLLFAYISSIFFHFPFAFYFIGFIVLLILIISFNKFNFMKYLKKEVKSRPSENIDNIIMKVKLSGVKDNEKVLRRGIVIASIILPLIIFYNPRIMYEKLNDGLSVRFYTFGLTNMTEAIIPSTHDGKDVISLRGNTFSNMPFLTKVTLPDTITEIRGQAFKNDSSIKEVTLPSKLKYLGGGSFANCSSLKKIEIPDSVTYIGGEAFSNCYALEEVKLSNNISEIRGNTFEYTNISTIDIPDKVTRIGGHAFYDCSNLKTVKISENSKLNEIGSSAFRECTNLYQINLPSGVDINERSFKESPTVINYYE